MRNNVVCLKNSCGIVHIEISKSEKEIGSNNMSMVNLSPTLNGVKLRKVINKEKFIKLNIDINETPYGIKFNEKYFSFMSHDITPVSYTHLYYLCCKAISGKNQKVEFDTPIYHHRTQDGNYVDGGIYIFEAENGVVVSNIASDTGCLLYTSFL